MLVVDMVHRHHSWVGLLIASLLWKEVQGAFRSVPVQGSVSSVSELLGVFSNRDLFFHLWWQSATKGNSKRLCVLVFSWTTLANNSKEGFSCLLLGFCYVVFGS